LLIQLYGVAVTLMWSGGVTFVLLKLVSAFVPLRVTREHELEARRGFAVNSSSKYLFPALRLGKIMSRLCPAYNLIWCDYILSATEWRMLARIPQNPKRPAFINR
jgi:hypothetical protein